VLDMSRGKRMHAVYESTTRMRYQGYFWGQKSLGAKVKEPCVNEHLANWAPGCSLNYLCLKAFTPLCTNRHTAAKCVEMQHHACSSDYMSYQMIYIYIYISSSCLKVPCN
jgi:hypothetical protein